MVCEALLDGETAEHGGPLLTSPDVVLGCHRHVLQVSRTLVTRPVYITEKLDHGSKTQLADLP